jgi:hypothetical protein
VERVRFARIIGEIPGISVPDRTEKSGEYENTDMNGKF